MGEMITLEEFTDLIKEIYAEGDTAKAYKRLGYFLEHEKTSTGKSLTVEFLIDKFRQHIDHWNKEYGERESKFIGVKDKQKRLNFYDFLGAQKYNHEYSAPLSKQRDKYLFPGLSIKELNQRIDKFYKFINRE